GIDVAVDIFVFDGAVPLGFQVLLNAHDRGIGAGSHTRPPFALCSVINILRPLHAMRACARAARMPGGGTTAPRAYHVFVISELTCDCALPTLATLAPAGGASAAVPGETLMAEC